MSDRDSNFNKIKPGFRLDSRRISKLVDQLEKFTNGDFKKAGDIISCAGGIFNAFLYITDRSPKGFWDLINNETFKTSILVSPAFKSLLDFIELEMGESISESNIEKAYQILRDLTVPDLNNISEEDFFRYMYPEAAARLEEKKDKEA